MISINRIFTLIVLILTTSISDVKSQSISTIGEIYNFEIGDIFHYEIESTTSCFKTLRIYKKAEISNRYYSTNYDTVFYVSKIKQLYLDDYAAGEWPDYYTDSAWYSETDNVLKFYTSLDAFLYSEEAYWNQTYIDSMKYNGRKINVIRDPESTCCSEAYADGIGQVSDSYWSHSSCNSHSYKLQYFKKGNEEFIKKILSYVGNVSFIKNLDEGVDFPKEKSMDFPKEKSMDFPKEKSMDFPKEKSMDFLKEKLIDFLKEKLMNFPKEK